MPEKKNTRDSIKNSLIKSLVMHCITLCGIGYWPASGTLASLVAWGFFQITSIPLLAAIIIWIAGFYSIECFLQNYNSKKLVDPSFIVIDEVMGYSLGFIILALAGIKSSTIPFFVLFRLFDIKKFSGIRYVEIFFPGAWGIILDDCAAACLAAFILIAPIPAIVTSIILHIIFNSSWFLS